MDIIRLFQEYNVDYVTEGNKHCSPGFVNTHCPHCSGSRDYHLGFDLSGGYFNCWRCGWHPVDITIAKLLGIRVSDARIIIREYGGVSKLHAPIKKEPIVRPKALKLPSNTQPLQKQHKSYLLKRKYDPTYLQNDWHVVGTGPISLLDGLNYGHRILAPIFWQGRMVSFQCRDITGKAELKYLTCPKSREIIHHKHILYGIEERFEKWDVCICTEGVFDVWRIGKYGVCTFGIKYTPEQLRLLARFERVVVWFDQEKQAQEQASKLIGELRFRGVRTGRIFTDTDPGDTPAEQVKIEIYKMLGDIL